MPENVNTLTTQYEIPHTELRGVNEVEWRSMVNVLNSIAIFNQSIKIYIAPLQDTYSEALLA